MTVVGEHVGSNVRRQRRQLPDEVAAYVREQIISGAVRPGEFLRVEPIAAAVGVSNTPVREGLLTLRSEGFVRLAPRRGFVVAPFTRQDVRDLFWAQAQLASELAARAAEKLTPEQLVRLDEILAEHDRAIDLGEPELMSDVGHRFHREINLAADSPRLALLLGSVVMHLPNTFYASIERQVKETRQTHPEIREALAAHDSETARRLMGQHVLQGADRLIEVLEARGLWDHPDGE